MLFLRGKTTVLLQNLISGNVQRVHKRVSVLQRKKQDLIMELGSGREMMCMLPEELNHSTIFIKY